MSVEKTPARSIRGSVLFPRCTVAGCDRQLYAHGYCSMHYQRVRANGDTITLRNTNTPVTDETNTEIVRGMRRFENPTKLARRLGVSVNHIHKIMRGQR